MKSAPEYPDSTPAAPMLFTIYLSGLLFCRRNGGGEESELRGRAQLLAHGQQRTTTTSTAFAKS